MSIENSVFRSLEIIENRIHEKLSVENIARGVYFSKYHYGRLFRDIVGDSVMDYVTKRKLTLAGSELLSTDKNVLDIALDFGYSSHDSFTRAFKAYMGLTPTEYRKYGLTAISQKQIKERYNMTYSQNTNEIIKELNEFIVKVKETAESARKCTLMEYIPFWNMIADNTDAFADRLKNNLDRITSISENPDAITSRFAIIKLLEDIAFETKLIGFNVTLMVSRGNAAHIEIQKPICGMFGDLARLADIKTTKVTGLFNELTTLIFDDMRKAATAKIQSLIQKGQKTTDEIQGYAYIRDEISNIVNELSQMPCEQVSVKSIEDFAFRLNIISFAADMDIFRRPSDKAIFDALKALKNDFLEAVDFLSASPNLKESTVIERTINKHFEDIAYQGNIMLFYVRGEVEKLGKLLTAEQKTSFDFICDKINQFIRFTINASETTDYKVMADMLNKIGVSLASQADILAEKGGAVRFLSNEFKYMAGIAV